MSEAISHYKMAIKIKPGFANSTLQPWEAALFQAKERMSEAIDLILQEAIKLQRPDLRRSTKES